MYDIEVIEGKSYAIIGEDTTSYNFIKSMNSRLTMKKLASEPGAELFLTPSEMAQINPRMNKIDWKRLVQVGLVSYDTERNWSGIAHTLTEKYSFTELGLEIVKEIKEYGGDIELRL